MDENQLTKRELKEQRRREKLSSNMNGNTSSGMGKLIIIVVGILIFLGFFGFIVYSIKQSKNKPVVISSSGYVRGSETAKVQLTEYGDLQCPACKAYEPVVEKIMKDYDGKVKLLFKHFPLTGAHKNAMLAAKVSVAAGNQDKFWEMHDWMYAHQEEWAALTGPEARAKMTAEAEKLKLDMEKFKKDVDAKETEDSITAMQNEGIEIGVAATPTFYLNNKKIETNPGDYNGFKKLIDEELARVK